MACARVNLGAEPQRVEDYCRLAVQLGLQRHQEESKLAFFTLNYLYTREWNARTAGHNRTHVAGPALQASTLQGVQQLVQTSQRSGHPSR